MKQANRLTRMMPLFLAICVRLAPSSAGAVEIAPEITRALEAAAADQELPLLLFFEETVDFSACEPGRACAKTLIPLMKETAVRSQSRVRALLARRGITGTRSFWINNSLVFTAPAALVSELRAFDEIAAIKSAAAPEIIRSPLQPLSDRTPFWNLLQVGADRVWEEFGIDGSGVVVGCIDAGVDADHPALAGKWRGGDNSWLDTISGLPYPYDDTGHGTHTTGTMIGGDGPGPFVFDIGLAHGAQFVAAKVFDSDGHPPDISYMFTGMQWIIDPDGDSDTDDFPHVINNSWVWGQGSTDFYAVVNFWRQVGIIPVFSIGNSGPNPQTTHPPGDYHMTFGVGATDASDLVADFSSRGPTPSGYAWPPDQRKPDLSAPGVNVSSCLPGGGYGVGSGTSMAAPHVAGAVALLLDADPGLGFDALYEALTETAVDVDAPGYDHNTGYGRLDIHAAVSRVLDETAVPAHGLGGLSLTAAPNPFQDRVRLSVGGEWEGRLRVELFDLRGRRLRTLASDASGRGIWIWDGRDERGRSLASGVYLARLDDGRRQAGLRLLLLR